MVEFIPALKCFAAIEKNALGKKHCDFCDEILEVKEGIFIDSNKWKYVACAEIVGGCVFSGWVHEECLEFYLNGEDD